MSLINTARTWVYSASVKGRFQRMHRRSGALLQAVLFVTPWILVDGHPAVQADVPGRRLYAFGAVFTPTDTLLLVLMGLFIAFTMFLFTAVYGRLWCGYACPQTVFLEEWVRPIEKWTEGERGVRMARDNGPLTFEKVWRKGAKWLAYLVLATVVAMAFMSWFAGARPLWTGQAASGYYGLTAAVTAVMFFDFAWFREQFCNFLCPYARFQGVLCDDQSLVVAYDAVRGEPRKDAGGACIDCNKCVAVCPQGIDIRDGFQLECVTCARCVDACQIVMDKRGQPNLINYATLSGERHNLRPRTLVYTSLLTVIALAFFTVLFTRSPVDGNISRVAGSTYVTDADGWIRNTYMLRLTNHENHAETWEVSVAGLDAAELIAPSIHLEGAGTTTVPVVVRVPPGHLSAQSVPLRVVVQAHDDVLLLNATFMSDGG